jgi:hypothetical protein
MAKDSMQRECSECQRLWREYAAATNNHVGLENRYRHLKGDPGAEALAREVAAAATAREGARQAIKKHETSAHGDAAAAETDGGRELAP